MNTRSKLSAAFAIAASLADAIRELKSVPSGHLYAQVSPLMSLHQFTAILNTLKSTGLVREDNSNVLHWVDQPNPSA